MSVFGMSEEERKKISDQHKVAMKKDEEKKTEFPFFCDLCNSGFFLNSIFLKHQGTKKHLSREKLSNINNDKIN
jgi:hypothetical protein